MIIPPQPLHPSFKLNGLQFNSLDEIRSLAYDLYSEDESYEQSIGKFILLWLNADDTIELETSGSTGDSKKVMIRKEHMANSALATGNYFLQGEDTSALLCLSASYIAGKMMLIRSMVLGLSMDLVSPNSNPMEDNKKKYDFAAMTPMQAFNSMSKLNLVE